MPDLPNRLLLLRPLDLLALELQTTNLRLAADGAHLQRMDETRPALLTFHFPSQHVAERAFTLAAEGSEPAQPPPIATIAAGPSRLVFALPEGVNQLALSNLLGWDTLVPQLAPNARRDAIQLRPRPEQPSDDVTAIEFPWRMFLSPGEESQWQHKQEPFTHDGRTEVWHTKLGAASRSVPVRAIGYRVVDDHLATSLRRRDIEDIVALSSDFGMRPKSWVELGMSQARWISITNQTRLNQFRYDPVPLEAYPLILSVLGASAHLRGQWQFPPPAYAVELLEQFGIRNRTLEKYDHIAGSGRDQFVRVVRRGWLSSTHRAALIRTTQRTFEPFVVRTEETPQGRVAIFGYRAYLRQTETIEVVQTVRDFEALAGAYEKGGREMPLRSVELTTTVTPPIDQRLDASGNPLPMPRLRLDANGDPLPWSEPPFWIRVKDADFEFGARATDWEGKSVSYRTPLMFIPDEHAGNYQLVWSIYASGPSQRRDRSFDNQTLALAGPLGTLARGSTSAPVDSLTFRLPKVVAPPAGYRPSWLYDVGKGRVFLEAAERITRQKTSVEFTFDPAYLAHGVEGAANPAACYATFDPITIRFPSERGGGVARPELSLARLSSRQGALPEALAGTAPPPDLKAILGNAKVLGTIELWQIARAPMSLDSSAFGLADLPEPAFVQIVEDAHALIEVPVLRTRELRNGDGVPRAVETRFVWKPKPNNVEGLLTFRGDTGLTLDSRVVVPLEGGSPSTDVFGELREFTLHLLEVVQVHIAGLVFISREGRKPDISAEGFSIEFEGPLRFVNTLQSLLPADGFSDPPAIEVTADGIQAGYTLGVPSVGIGIFSIQNLALSAGLAIPFTDKPAGLRFAICERHRPFIVTVTIFGGGGFFALGVSAKGLEEMEAAIEFGGNICLNLGVASGGVYVMAGIYFGMIAQATTLTGYLRAGGHLCVLGIISISIEFYLAFTFRAVAGGSEVWGQGSVCVSVKIAFISKSVTLTVEKRFAGAGGDPTFDDTMAPEDWESYLLAFAA